MQVVPQMFSLAINFSTQKFLQAQRKDGLGTIDAAVAYTISAWLVALAQLVYVFGLLEIWYFMMIIVLTGHLGDPVIAVGSLSICMNINGWEGMLFLGINAAISVRASNELGSAHPRVAKYSVIITVIQLLLIGILSALAVLATRNKFVVIFTNSIEMRCKRP
ncbi:ARID/BRIGHT DNA-binding domain,ELM2 domain protein, putative isoform 1 [Hibiscus syriacus]|uniref:ARID/BRIGHT DNA-binding domain,ELM2 domain protein, putative isoform 1 n=1 Tax=Hibiscus syriacus TaxID=106335 RepID=A0A6A3D3F5_HIBSY|nr:ARID/BRIGHT DNA-binding domain,ELM2 domain protein, putative isoform 1 [Hibiscus syriacus]